MRRLTILVGTICLSLIVLQAAVAAEPGAGEDADTATDEAAIKKVNATLIEAFNAGDVASAVALVMDDAADLPPNRPAIIGKDAVRAYLQSDLDRFAMHFVDEIVEVQIEGNLAVLWTSYTATLTPRDGGEPIRSRGKWLKVLRRQPDGSWKYSRNIWNSDAPRPEHPGG